MASGMVRGQAQETTESFYAPLEAYGEWIEVGDYGYCWHPTNVDSNWGPYTLGHWDYTDDGWMWDSDEPFGSIVYHYGRWVNVEDAGWCWVPGHEWAPAWVSFRYSNDYVGWTPLPPEAEFSGHIGFGAWVDSYYGVGPSHYYFVPVRAFGDRDLREAFIPRDQCINIFGETRNVTQITTRNNMVFVGGPKFETISARAGHPLTQLKLERRTDINATMLAGDQGRAKMEGNRLIVAAPNVAAGTSAAAPPNLGRKIESAKVDRGWNQVDPAKAAQLKAKTQAEAKPPTGLPPQPKYEAAHAAGTPASNGNPPSGASTPSSREMATPGRETAQPSARPTSTPERALSKPTPTAAPSVTRNRPQNTPGAEPSTAATPNSRKQQYPEGNRTPSRAEMPGQARTPMERPPTAATPSEQRQRPPAETAPARENVKPVQTPKPRPQEALPRQEQKAAPQQREEKGQSEKGEAKPTP